MLGWADLRALALVALTVLLTVSAAVAQTPEESEAFKRWDRVATAAEGTIADTETTTDELETLREVLGNPQDYLVTEQVTLRLNTLNVVVDADESGVAADVGFSLVRLAGSEPLQRAFVLARVARSELPETRINFADAQRYL